MDQDAEFKRAKWLLGAAGIFLISCFMAFDEMRYMILGRTSKGRITQVKPYSEPGRRGRTNQRLSVEYSFKTEPQGSILNERDNVSSDWQLPEGGSVPIQYISGSPDSSRLAGNRNMMWVIVFFGSLGIMSVFLFMLYLEAKQPTKRKPVRR